MKEPLWLQDDVVTAIHSRQLAEHGGLDGIRDPGMLSSALARPKNAFAYSQPKPDIPALAAAYAFGIAKNHPFVDGNKRTAYVLCRTFLMLNGQDINATDMDKYQTFLRVADGTIDESQLADWIRSRLA
jgi:death-on-curing protein